VGGDHGPKQDKAITATLRNNHGKSSPPSGDPRTGLNTAPGQVPAPLRPWASPRNFPAASTRLPHSFHNEHSALLRCSIKVLLPGLEHGYVRKDTVI
jgi:hypothetical protein